MDRPIYTIMKFTLDEQYITDVTIHKEWSMYYKTPVEKLTPDELIKIIKGEDRVSSTHSEDHPEFAQLRNQLEAEGYIKCQRSWWNGDVVLKPFTLNDIKFKKNDRFVSAGAMNSALKVAKQTGRKYNPKY